MDVSYVLEQKPNSTVETIGSHETLRTLAESLRDKKIGAMIVVDEESRLAGVISERDIIRALGQDGDAALSCPVARYMTREVRTAGLRDNVYNVLERMTSGRFRHMPVLDGGSVVGVISIGDVVATRIEALQKDNEAMQAFIHG